MRSFLGLISPIEHVYQEELPSDNAQFKETAKAAEATLKRIEDLKFKALMQGKVILGQSRTRKGFEIFKEPYREPKKDLPKIKISQLEPLSKTPNE